MTSGTGGCGIKSWPTDGGGYEYETKNLLRNIEAIMKRTVKLLEQIRDELVRMQKHEDRYCRCSQPMRATLANGESKCLRCQKGMV